MEIEPHLAGKIVIGAKQTLRAVERDGVVSVYVAADADEHVIIPILEACRQHGVLATEVATKVKLGKDCGLTIGAATCAVLK